MAYYKSLMIEDEGEGNRLIFISLSFPPPPFHYLKRLTSHAPLNKIQLLLSLISPRTLSTNAI